MSITTKLSKDVSGKDIEQKLYRSMIRSLILLIASHPDISFSVGACARYQVNPKESHLMYIERIIHNLNETLNYDLWYPYDSSFVITGYSDVDWAKNNEDKKFTSGACYFIGDCLVAWFSKKQNSISLSTTEAKDIVVGSRCTQLLWMKQMLKDYGTKQRTICIHYDNPSAITILKNHVLHSHTKHTEIHHHVIRDLIEKRLFL